MTFPMLQRCFSLKFLASVGAIADRRDFYDQFAVTQERSAVFPPFALKELYGCKAYDRFTEDFGTSATKRKKDRELAGHAPPCGLRG